MPARLTLAVLAAALAVPPAIVAAPAAGSTRPRRVLAPAVLSLSPPLLAAPLLSGVRATVQPAARYRGDGVLAWELLSGPEGMTADAPSGLLFWTPPAAVEGTAPEVRVRATDGSATAEVTFTLPVAAPSPVASTVVGRTLTATAGSLQGVAWTFPAETSRPLGELSVSTLPAGQAPPLPPGATRVSDFFRVTPVSAGDGATITVALPKRLVPAGRASHELRVWVYTARVTGADAPEWVCTWRERDVLPGGTATMKLKDLGELSFVGVPATPAAAVPATGGAIRVARSTPVAGHRAVTFTCEQKLLADGTRDPSTQHCAVASSPPFEVWVKDFDRHQWTPRATVTDLVGWLVASRDKLLAFQLTSEPVFEVLIENIPNATWLGFVSGAEDFWTLHLDDEARRTRDQMQCTTAHEFFHHAQSRTRVEGLHNVLIQGYQQTQWLVEATARWFEDEVFDGLDSYGTLNTWPLPHVLVPGLAAIPAPGDPQRDPYNRFAYFKMLYNRCPGFNLASLFNVNLGTDPNATYKLRSAVQSWKCDFDDGFQPATAMRSNLATSLLLYTWATQFKQEFSLLDPNEPRWLTEAASQQPRIDAGCRGPGSCPPSASVAGVLPPLGAAAVLVPGLSTVPADHEIVVEAVTGYLGEYPTWSWMGEYRASDMTGTGRMQGAGTLRWRGAPGAGSPSLAIIFVNPALAGNGPYSVYAKLLNREPRTTIIRIERDYPDNGFGTPIEAFKYRCTAQATVTGLGGMQFLPLTESDPRYPGTWTQTVLSSGLTPPYTVRLAGTIDVEPIPPAGSYRAAGAARTFHWQFGQKRYVNDCSHRLGISDAPGFSVEFSAVDGDEQFSGGPCVEFTYGTWETDDKGNIYNNWGYSFSPRGSLTLEVNPY